jgi:hypothetical protein
VTREEAERLAAQHAGAIVGRVVRDPEGRLVIDIPPSWPGPCLELIGPRAMEEGEYVVLAPNGNR